MLMRTSVMAIGGTALVLMVGGCPLLDVQVETQEVCLTYTGLEVPGVDAGGSVHEEFVFDDLGSLDGLDQLDGSARFVRVDLHATSGVADFGFLGSARVTVASGDPDSSLPEVTAVDCSGDGCARDGADLSIFAASDVDAVPYLRSGSVAITIDASGQLPAESWTVDVDVCMAGSAGYHQGL
jgi:hypothetical protein